MKVTKDKPDDLLQQKALNCNQIAKLRLIEAVQSEMQWDSQTRS